MLLGNLAAALAGALWSWLTARRVLCEGSALPLSIRQSMQHKGLREPSALCPASPTHTSFHTWNTLCLSKGSPHRLSLVPNIFLNCGLMSIKDEVEIISLVTKCSSPQLTNCYSEIKIKNKWANAVGSLAAARISIFMQRGTS